MLIEVCKGQAGLALYVDGTRVAGVRDNGLMTIVLSANVPDARAWAAEKALREIATECSTFPIKDGLAFRCESIARAALGAKP